MRLLQYDSQEIMVTCSSVVVVEMEKITLRRTVEAESVGLDD